MHEISSTQTSSAAAGGANGTLLQQSTTRQHTKRLAAFWLTLPSNCLHDSLTRELLVPSVLSQRVTPRPVFHTPRPLSSSSHPTARCRPPASRPLRRGLFTQLTLTTMRLTIPHFSSTSISSSGVSYDVVGDDARLRPCSSCLPEWVSLFAQVGIPSHVAQHGAALPVGAGRLGMMMCHNRCGASWPRRTNQWAMDLASLAGIAPDVHVKSPERLIVQGQQVDDGGLDQVAGCTSLAAERLVHRTNH